ncbi:DNA-3-methyladenine glycosylase I [Pulveribacter sp.]|uniref:DNA-3-methyladenine glycosylase I n=1 Tax=Pulveribacter sp. TaxID=2678893 RepID=UPI0028A6C441|nr:DNA-3-methyladenine glycosylase I [Pulveribacter sp.]
MTDPATPAPDGLFADEGGCLRCSWCRATPLYRHYHDHEWGFPVDDERHLFEKLCLEGFQAGLSWLTILNKREALRAELAQFEAEELARFGPAEVERMLGNPAIVRHRGKIESAIHNARCVLRLRAEWGSLASYVWSWAPQAQQGRPERLTGAAVRALTTSEASAALSKDLKKRGFSFVGPTTMYAFMQAMGLVNDHVHGCSVRERAQAQRAAFVPPTGSGHGV